MNAAWPTVKLGEVLRQRKEFVLVDDQVEYARPRVRLHAQGIVLRDRVPGALIKTKRQQVCRPGELLVAEIDAKAGGFGIVPTELEGAIVSSHYFLFQVLDSRLDVRFLDFYVRTIGFMEQVEAQGTTNYAAIRSSDVLNYETPLPPIAEQRRIVAKIEELAAQIAEARALREQSAVDLESMLVGLAHRTDLNDEAKRAAGWRTMPLQECMILVDDSHRVSVDRSYPNLGIYSYARGLFHKPPIEGMNTSAPALRRVRAGQFIYSRLFAFEGAYGMVTQEYDGHFVSGEYPTFNCNPDTVRVEFLEAYFKAPSVWREIAVGSKGLGNRRQRVQPAQVLSHRAWIPPLAWQALIAQTRTRIDELKRLHDETAAELDALMPAILDLAFRGEL